MSEPTLSQQRVMIYRPPARRLADGCDNCNMSLTYCQAVTEMEARRCCRNCRH